MLVCIALGTHFKACTEIILYKTLVTGTKGRFSYHSPNFCKIKANSATWNRQRDVLVLWMLCGTALFWSISLITALRESRIATIFSQEAGKCGGYQPLCEHWKVPDVVCTCTECPSGTSGLAPNSHCLMLVSQPGLSCLMCANLILTIQASWYQISWGLCCSITNLSVPLPSLRSVEEDDKWQSRCRTTITLSIKLPR